MAEPDTLPLNMPATSRAAPVASLFDPQIFVRTNRIHIEHSADFDTGNPLLVVNKPELAPANENNFRAKISNIYDQKRPFCFLTVLQYPMVNAFSPLVPPSIAAREAQNAQNAQEVMHDIALGKNSAAEAQKAKEEKPFAAVIAETLENQKIGPIQSEMLQNGIGLSLLLEKAVEGKKYTDGLNTLLGSPDTQQGVTAEQLLGRIQPYTGIAPNAFIKAARESGLDEVGKLLGVDPAYVREIRQLVNALPEYEFSTNAVEDWKAGRDLPGMAHTGIHEKIAAGRELRITAKIAELRAKVNGNFTEPEEVQAMQRMLASHLGKLPANINEVLFRNGTEFVYTPSPDLSRIAGIRALGFHRFVTQHPGNTTGVRDIYTSGAQGDESGAEVVLHEACHLLMPNQLSDLDIARTDALVRSDADRLAAMLPVLKRWAEGGPAEKEAARQELDQRFSASGVSISSLTKTKEYPNGDLNTLVTLAGEMSQKLNFQSNWFNRSGYDSVTSRFNEINSRYAEKRYGGRRDQLELLKAIVPGITEAHEQIYLPHIDRELAELRLRDSERARQRNGATASSGKMAANDILAASEPLAPESTAKIPSPPPIAVTPAAAAADLPLAANDFLPNTHIATATASLIPPQAGLLRSGMTF